MREHNTTGPLPPAQEQISDYEQAYSLYQKAMQENQNTLALPPLGDGTVVCIRSMLTANSPHIHDSIDRTDEDLVRTQSFPSMNLTAAYVGLWPRTAAAYYMDIPVQLPDNLVHAPFVDVMRQVIGSEYLGEYRRMIFVDDATTSAIALSGDYKEGATPLIVVGTSETTIEHEVYGSLDDVDGLEIRMHGRARLQIPQNYVMKLLSSEVYCGPAEPTTIRHHIPADRPLIVRPTVGKGATVQLDNNGSVEVSGPSPFTGRTFDEFEHNPRIAGEQVGRFLGAALELRDITLELLEDRKSDIKERLPVDPAASYQQALGIAHDNFNRRMQVGPKIEPLAIGFSEVRAWLGDYLEGMRKNNRQRTIVDADFFINAR